jgi:hypothetical protein
MRSYCRLSDAELALNDLAKAQQYVDSAVPFFNEFKPDSNSLLVLRDLGLCYRSIGNVPRRIASDQSLSASDRRSAEAQAHQWYLKSAGVWNEWVRRGAATPESEVEQRKVERLLHAK